MSQHIKEAKQRLTALGHLLTEPANQYCANCGKAMFTSVGTLPCSRPTPSEAFGVISDLILHPKERVET